MTGRDDGVKPRRKGGRTGIQDNGHRIGDRIRRLRLHILKIPSQIEFAERLGVSRGAVGNWETGQGIKRSSLEKIVEAFGVSYEWLATGIGQPRESRPLEYRIRELLADDDDEADDFIALVEIMLQERARQLRDRRKS